MNQIHGEIQRVSVKTTKNPEWQNVGILVNETWYNVITKYVDSLQVGTTVTFELRDTGLVDTKTLHYEKPPGDVSAALKPSGGSQIEGKLVSALKALVSRIDTIDQKLDVLVRALVTFEDKPAPAEKTTKKKTAPPAEDDGIPF